MNIPDCLNFLRPGAEWGLTGNDFSTLEWYGPGEAPTLEEINAAWEQLQASPAVSVKMLSMHLALVEAGLEQPLIDAIESIPDDIERRTFRAWWERSPTVERNHPIVTQLAAALNQSAAQVDALFATAKLKDSV